MWVYMCVYVALFQSFHNMFVVDVALFQSFHNMFVAVVKIYSYPLSDLVRVRSYY